MSVSQYFANIKEIREFNLRKFNLNSDSDIHNTIKDIFNFAVLKDHSTNHKHKYNIWKNELYNLYNCYRESKKYSGDIHSMDYPQIFKDLFKSLEIILSTEDGKIVELATRICRQSFRDNITHRYSAFIFSHLLLGYSHKEYIPLLYEMGTESRIWIKNLTTYSYPQQKPFVFTFERSLDDIIYSENVSIEFKKIKNHIFFLTAENKKLKSQLGLLESQMCKCGSIEKYDYELIKNRNKKLHKELKTMFKLFHRRSVRENTDLECIPFAVVV